MALLLPRAPDFNIESCDIAPGRSGKKIRSAFQCARPLSILRSGVGGRIISCRAAQVVQTFFFQPFEQDEQTHNMMFVFVVPYESTSGPQWPLNDHERPLVISQVAVSGLAF